MADEVKDGVSAEPEKKTAESRNPIASVMLIINSIFLVAIGYFQYRAHQMDLAKPSVRDIVKAEMKQMEQEKIKGEEEVDKDSEGLLLPLESFTANLSQSDGPRRYLRMNAVLKFSRNSKEEEFKSRKPQIRDAIISIINSKRPEDLLKVEGKRYLKEEIKSAINSFLIDGNVEDVFYVSFQIH
jgi:flagellar FliL protein